MIVTESVFSMDGTRAPLAALAALARAHDALLVVDEAHAFGLWGERGSGLAEAEGLLDPATAPALARILTFGKALGLGGAAIVGPRVLIDLLVSTARAFLFTTAPPPLLAIAIDAALDHLAAHPERAQRLRDLADRLRARLAAAGVTAGGDRGIPIVPVLVGGNEAAMAVAAEVAAAGFDARAVRPPTVAPGTARLRLSVHADHDDVALDALADAVAAALRRAGALPRPALPPSSDEPPRPRHRHRRRQDRHLRPAPAALGDGARPRLLEADRQRRDAEDRDADSVRELCTARFEVLPETYSFQEALSPHLAARHEGVEIDPDRVLADLARYRERRRGLVVEGAGGAARAAHRLGLPALRPRLADAAAGAARRPLDARHHQPHAAHPRGPARPSRRGPLGGHRRTA